MDRFEQLHAYFNVVSDFHRNRDQLICNVDSLTRAMPDLLGQITQPTLKRRLQAVMAANGHFLARAG